MLGKQACWPAPYLAASLGRIRCFELSYHPQRAALSLHALAWLALKGHGTFAWGEHARIPLRQRQRTHPWSSLGLCCHSPALDQCLRIAWHPYEPSCCIPGSGSLLESQSLSGSCKAQRAQGGIAEAARKALAAGGMPLALAAACASAL